MFRVNDILDGQKGDQGGGPKMAKILGGVKFQQAEKVGSAQN